MKNKEVKKKNNFKLSDVKDMLSKGVKKVLKKSKKNFIKILKLIKKLLKLLKDKFMDLPQKIRMIIYVWGVVFILLLFLILATGSSKKFYNKYTTYESKVSAAAKSYVEDKNLYATIDKKIIVDLAVLKEENYLGKTELDDTTCEGYSIIYYEDEKSEFIVDSYLNCSKYTSKYYWDYK